MIDNQLTNLVLGTNGFLLFAGINQYDEEILEVVEPPNTVPEFFYHCGKKFITERFEPLFQQSSIGHLIFISGHETLLYRYSNGNFSKIKTIQANISKRHNKGGQSSVRFSRLAEESRVSYINLVIDQINNLPGDKNYLFGSQELKEQLLSSKNLKVKIKTDDCYYTFTDQTYKERYFKTLMIDTDQTIDEQAKLVYELLDLNPDLLIFGRQDIEEYSDQLEFVLDCCKIPGSSRYYSRLRNLGLIGKLYFTF